MKIFFSVLMIILSVCSQAQVSEGVSPIWNYQPKDYKAGNQNIDFAQNRNLSLFVANNLGILSYDGSHWANHAFAAGKKKRSLAFDEKINRLYIGLQGDFGYMDDDWVYHSLSPMIPDGYKDFDDVWDVYLVGAKVVFCTFQRLYIYEDEGIKTLSQDQGLQKAFWSDDQLYIQTVAGHLMHLTEDRLVKVSLGMAHDQGKESISGIVTRGDALVVIYNSGEIVSSVDHIRSQGYEALRRALLGTYVNHVLSLSDGRLAIATQTSGVIIYDEQEDMVEYFDVDHGLLSNACLRTFQDFEGNLWVGMQNGIAMINILSPMRLVNESIDVEGSGYDTYERDEGKYYTTSNGIYFLKKGQQTCQLVSETEGPSYDLFVFGDQLYAGHHTGLFALADGYARRIADTNGLWTVKSLRQSPGYAIGGTYAGLHIFRLDEGGTLTSLGMTKGFDESSRFFEEAQDGTIWVSQYYKGLYKVELTDDLLEASVSRVVADGLLIDGQVIISKIEGELLLGTSKGIYTLDQTTGAIAVAPMYAENIGEQPVYLIEQDAKKNIHIIADKVVGYYKKISKANYVFVSSSILQQRYLLNNDLLNISAQHANGVYYSANNGFLFYNPNLENQVSSKYAPVTTSVKCIGPDTILFRLSSFSGPNGYDDVLHVPKGADVLQFQVGAFQFAAANSLSYRFKLEGFEDEYSAWGSMATKEYTNLDGGEYVFKAQVRNHLKDVLDTEPMMLTVPPPFFQTALAKWLGFAGLGLFMFLVYRSQKKRYQQKAKVINESRHLALEKKQQKLIEIEQEKEKELTLLKEEKMKSELEHLNSLLAASTMNIVVKNEFIQTIKESLYHLQEVSKGAMAKKALDKLVREIDTNIRLDQDWEQFELHFDKVHGGFLKRLREKYTDLTPNDQKLCAFLRLNLSTKEIAHLMSVSLRGVEVARYRLRKKLDLQKGQNLSKFILEY